MWRGHCVINEPCGFPAGCVYFTTIESCLVATESIATLLNVITNTITLVSLFFHGEFGVALTRRMATQHPRQIVFSIGHSLSARRHVYGRGVGEAITLRFA